MAQTITDFLSQPGPTGNLVPVVGVYVRLVDNSTLTAYASTAATDSKGAWTITGLPPGGYTVYTGPAATGPWTATGDANYVVGPNLDIAGIIPDSALSTNVALLAGAQTFTGAKTFSAALVPATAAGIGLQVQGLASQTGDLQRWLKSDGTVLASVSAAGAPTFAQPITLSMSNGIVLGNVGGTTYLAYAGGQGWYMAASGTQLFQTLPGPGAGRGMFEIQSAAAAGNEFSVFQVASGTVTMNASPASTGTNRFKQVTYSAAAPQTAAAAATVLIDGAPIAGANFAITNPLALWAQAGKVQFDGDVQLGGAANKFGAFGSAGAVKQTVTGAKGGNAALASLLAALSAMGLVTDSSGA